VRDKYGPAADMWSIGAIFFQLLTGELLVDLDRERSSSAELMRNLKAVVAGSQHGLQDDAKAKICSEEFIARRLAVAQRCAPARACELLQQMLQQDPKRRITASQALKHRFVTGSYLTTPRAGNQGCFDEDVISKLRRFAAAPAMRRLAVLVEAHLLGPQDDAMINKEVMAFRAADEQGLGALTVHDIAAVLATQDLQVPEDLHDICERVDVGQEGSINLTEFVAATMEPRLYCEPRLCLAAFRILDANGDGCITQSDLEVVLSGSPQCSKTAAAILQSAGPDSHGRVNFKQFCKVMVPHGATPGLAVRVAEYMATSFV